MPATGPDFISLQARDLDASQAFYEQYLGLVRSQAGPPHAVVFETKPIAFALRDVVPGTDLASVAQPGIGAAIWLHATDVQAIHDALVADGHTIVSAPIDGPFGRTFTFADPDGYQVTLHRASEIRQSGVHGAGSTQTHGVVESDRFVCDMVALSGQVGGEPAGLDGLGDFAAGGVGPASAQSDPWLEQVGVPGVVSVHLSQPTVGFRSVAGHGGDSRQLRYPRGLQAG